MPPTYDIRVGYLSSTMRSLPRRGLFDGLAAQIQRIARDKTAKSQVTFIFPFDEPDMPPIQELMQLWAGWVDESGSYLQAPDPPYIGYIMVSDGGQDGGEHDIRCDVYSLNCLPPRCTVVGWPTGEDTGMPTAGMQEGLSVWQWLVGRAGVGGQSYDGVIRYYLPNLDYSGVAPYFDSLIFTAATMPGGNIQTSTVFNFVGQWGMTDLETILQDIVGAARAAGEAVGAEIQPLYFFDTVAEGSRLRPRFRFIDALDTSGPRKGRFTSEPTVGDLVLKHARHRRDGTQVWTDVVFTSGAVDDLGNLILSRYQAHNGDYPAEYLRNGWGAKPRIETKIVDQAHCDRVAATVGQRVWGAIGTLTTETNGQPYGTTDRVIFQEGDLITWHDPAEGQDEHAFIVRGVRSLRGNYTDVEVKVGDLEVDATDLVRGATVVRPLPTAGGRGGADAQSGGGLGAFGLPGSPVKVAVERAPVHSGQNLILPAFNDTRGLRIQASGRNRDDGAPVLEGAYTFEVAPPATADNPHPAPGTYTSPADGRPHPCEFHAGVYTADGTYPLTVAVRTITLTAIDLAGTGSVTLLRDGTPVSSAVSGDGHHVLATPVTYLPSPALGTPGNKLGITLAGTDSGDELYVVLWEA